MSEVLDRERAVLIPGYLADITQWGAGGSAWFTPSGHTPSLKEVRAGTEVAGSRNHGRILLADWPETHV